MMAKPRKTEPQIDRFRQKARELECDEGEAAFEDKLRRIVQQKSEKEKTTEN